VHSDDGRTYTVDPAKTEEYRSRERSARLAEGKPVGEWLQQERGLVLKREFVPEVLAMYRDSMQLSPTWKQEFATFWQLPEDFSL
jgi:acetone carboxylase, alpha subunit